MVRAPAMRSLALVDLYFPAHAAPLADIQAAATTAGLDGIFVVAESSDEAPSADELAAVNALGGARVHVAHVVTGAGFRLLVLPPPSGLSGVGLDALEAATDERMVFAMLAELGAVAVSVAPRQGEHGTVARRVAHPSDDLGPGAKASKPGVGVVALVTGGSRLGRDLDIEDTALHGRRILGATGPFGQLADLGRYASLVPGHADSLASLVDGLRAGLGMAIELGPRRGAKSHHTAPVEPDEGRDDGPPQKRGRRRRRRGPRPGGAPDAA